jgi:hypothetical protein
MMLSRLRRASDPFRLTLVLLGRCFAWRVALASVQPGTLCTCRRALAAGTWAAEMMTEAGFRTFLTGVAMQRPNATGYNRPDCFVLDDWR